jgi:monoamine oxidase
VTQVAADLTGVSVLVAGAGLAGLSAARDLARWGAKVTVVEARERVGGRVLTMRDGFAGEQHGEAGGDMIDEGQHAIRDLAADLGLSLVRILRNGWGFVTSSARPSTAGRGPSTAGRSVAGGWARLADALSDVSQAYRLTEKRWDTPIATELARCSVARWLDETGADRSVRDTAMALRGFFLADPDELSLLSLVDQFSGDGSTLGKMYRIKGGNDLLAARLAAGLGDRLHAGVEVLAVSQRGKRVRVAVRHRYQTSQLTADYAVLALPTTLLRRIPFTPSLPARQHDAIARLKYGRATKTLLQFPNRFWRTPGRPRAFGSPLPFGAVWDGNEEQRGRAGILALMAGGAASDATADLVSRSGINGLSGWLDWLGSRKTHVTASRQVRWEADAWSRGGYAVFDTSFDPSLRSWLALPHNRLFFAGEHTSVAWQGYMNGAVESGRRAAAEVAAAHRLTL